MPFYEILVCVCVCVCALCMMLLVLEMNTDCFSNNLKETVRSNNKSQQWFLEG